jgi:CDP-diglyceride synthetase
VRITASEKTAALDININLGGLLYLGWLGSYLISLQPAGWFVVVPGHACIWFNDCYLVSSRIGKHKLAP